MCTTNFLQKITKFIVSYIATTCFYEPRKTLKIKFVQNFKN